MRRTLGVVVWALASFGAAQPVALSHWDPFLTGPNGAISHHGTDIAFWRGPALQHRVYMTGGYTSGARGRIPLFDYDWSGNTVASSNLHTAEAQSVTDGKVAGGWAMNVYFAGSMVPGPSLTRNIALFQRGLGLGMGWNRFLDAGGDDRLVDLVIDQNDAESAYLLGTTTTAGVNRWFIAKYSANGTFQFLRTGEANSIATALAVDFEGSTYTTYALLVDGVLQSRIVKHSSNGTYQWRNGYNPTQENDVAFLSVAVSAGNVFAAGMVTEGATGRPMTAVFNESGTRIRNEVKSTVNGYFGKAVTAGRGTFFAAGMDNSASKGLISAFYDPDESATSVWYRKAAPPNINAISFEDATANDTDLYMTANYGRSDMAGQGIFAAKYSIGGASRWTYNNFVANERREANAMTVHPETGQVWLAGRQVSGLTSYILKAALSQPATAVNDGYEGQSNQILVGSVTLNDTFSGGGNVQLVTPAVGGDLVLQPNGSFSYTPPNGFTGLKSFQYRIRRNGVSDSNVATVQMNFL